MRGPWRTSRADPAPGLTAPALAPDAAPAAGLDLPAPASPIAAALAGEAAEPLIETLLPPPGLVAEPAPAAPPPRRGVLQRARSLRTFDALGSTSYRWFFVSMLSQFSSMHMQMVVTPWLVFELTGSYALLGVFALASSVPGLALGFAGGVVADRAPKKFVVQVGQAVSALSTAAIAVLLVFDALVFNHLVIVSVIQGAVFAIIGPARQALIAEIVGPRRLTNAIALNMAGLNVTRMGVPALGGFLIPVIGAEGVYFLMAGLIFAAMASLTPCTRYRPGEDGEEPDADGLVAPAVPVIATAEHSARSLRGGVQDVGDGLRYIMADRVILTLLMVNFFIVLMSMPYMQMMAGFVKEVLGGGPEQLGLLWSITGIGSLVGSLVIASMPNRGRGKAFLISALVLGVALVGFAASTWLWVTAVIMLAVGVGQAGRMSLSNILIMHYTQPSFTGRVMSLYMMEFSLVAFGTFLVGVVASVVGIQWAIAFTAFSLIAIAVYSWLFVRRVRDLP